MPVGHLRSRCSQAVLLAAELFFSAAGLHCRQSAMASGAEWHVSVHCSEPSFARSACGCGLLPHPPGDGMAHMRSVRGPYTLYAAATCSEPLLPMILLPGQMPKMLPTAKLAPTMLLPSSGSKATL